MIRINYTFFIFSVLVPMIVWPIGILISYPMIASGYPAVILGSTFNVILSGLVFTLFFGVLAAWYVNIAYLVRIKEDRITIYGLRKILTIYLKDVDHVNFLYAKIPTETEAKMKICNIKWDMKDGDYIISGGISGNVAEKIKEQLSREKIPWVNSMEKLSEDVMKRFRKRGY